MNIAVTQIIDYFVRMHRTLVIETREFKTLRHNEDLCPRFQYQLETILRAMGKFEPWVYDTQGFHDRGADVVIRVRNERASDHERPELFAFQIKSYADFRQPDLFRTLKAQRDDAFRKIANLSAYYLALCTDEHKDKAIVRNIEAEFQDAERTLIIEPTYCLNFIRLPERKIEGSVTRIEQAEDIVFRRALETIDLPSPTAALLALYVATLESERATALNANVLKNQTALERLYTTTLENRRIARERLGEPIEDDEDDLPDLRKLQPSRPLTEASRKRMTEVFFDNFDDALAYDLDILDTHLIDVDSNSGRIAVRRDAVLPLIALLTDAKVRYGLEGADLFEYGAETLGMLDEEAETIEPE